MSTLSRRALPGFGLSLGFAVTYLSLLVLLPLAACFIKAASLTPGQFLAAVWTERTRAAYALTFGASLIAAALNVLLGLLVAWVLARYSFPLKRLVDALVDLPFALPTAVAGLVFSNLFVADGWLGQFLVPLGIEGAYSRLAIVLVLTFTGFPFVVRTVQPVLQALANPYPSLTTGVDPGGADGLRPGAGPRPGGIRVGRVHLREQTISNRDRAGSHRRPVGGIRIRGGDCRGCCVAHAVLRLADPDQPAGTVEQTACGLKTYSENPSSP